MTVSLNAGWRWAARLSGAGLLAAMAGIHLRLYDLGYATVPAIGPLFALDAALGGALALAVLGTPARWLPAVSALGALLQAGTLAGLGLSLTVGIFGFRETVAAPYVGWAVAVETAGFLVLAALAVAELPPLTGAVRRRRAAESGRR